MSSSTFFITSFLIIASLGLLYGIDRVISRNIGRLGQLIDPSKVNTRSLQTTLDILIFLIILTSFGVAYFLYPTIEKIGISDWFLKPKHTEVVAIPLTSTAAVLDASKTYSLTPTNTTSSTPTLTFTPTDIPIPTEAPPVRVSRTTDEELNSIPSIWNAFVIELKFTSGNYQQSYDISVSATDEYRWLFYWCTTDQTQLDENVSAMSVDFMIGDNILPADRIYTYQDTARTYYKKTLVSWDCQNWSTTLSDWLPNSEIVLSIRVNLVETLFDGIDYYQQGTYWRKLNIQVK